LCLGGETALGDLPEVRAQNVNQKRARATDLASGGAGTMHELKAVGLDFDEGLVTPEIFPRRQTIQFCRDAVLELFPQCPHRHAN
jgi:hypothetical protein